MTTRQATPKQLRDEAARRVENASDELAVALGMGFSVNRAKYVCGWIEENCHLYEGDRAGEPFTLMPYQEQFLYRLFGWVRESESGGWVRRFTRASLWCPKKNGKSPLLAAIGLYLACGDNEQGQKVYMAAKNGDQAKISQRHAVAMVEQSPRLRADCRVNRTTLQVTHAPTRSTMLILTGDDSRGAKAKEGINGSVLIDECHVFDREMHERTSRAGISRREPLNLSVSTAGDDPSSYGYERCEYGRAVNAGTRDDPGFLHVEYAAPQDVTDAGIDDDLEAHGKAANPAWGHIVKPTEFAQDWKGVKGNPREVARFKQYRLNVWVGSTNQWLDLAGWEKGRRGFGVGDLRGRSCYLGLDLSRTRDMTAAVFAFPWDEDGPDAVRLWPLFWLPERTARDRDHLFPFRQWAAGGFIRLIPGEVVDYARVEADITELASGSDFHVEGLYFDQTYAEEITQRLSETLYCDRVAVPQSMMGLTAVAKEFERRVVAGAVQHPGNPVLTWQAGHVEVKTDYNQNIRPVKPAPLSGKSIDGIMATLDSLAGVMTATAADTAPSVSFM